MPFARAGMPSIQVGLLRAIAEQAGFPADSFHFNVDLAARLGPEVHEKLCDHRGRMTGEWLFSVAAFGGLVAGDDRAYVEAFPHEMVPLTGGI
jgi:hypothetical protein